MPWTKIDQHILTNIFDESDQNLMQIPANDKNIPTKKLYRSILKVEWNFIKKGSEIKNFQVNDIKS
jgi:hypothetical protein